MSLKITLKSKIKQNNEVVGTEVDNETIMMSIENGTYYGLNSIASRIWEIIEAPKTINQIKNTLVEEYDVTEEECIKDLMTLIENLNKYNLLSIL